MVASGRRADGADGALDGQIGPGHVGRCAVVAQLERGGVTHISVAGVEKEAAEESDHEMEYAGRLDPPLLIRRGAISLQLA